MKKYNITNTVNSIKNPYGRVLIEHRDKYGNLVKNYDQPLRSFVSNWWRRKYQQYASFNTKYITFPTITGGTHNIWYYYNVQMTSINTINGGIRVGTDNTPVSIDDSTLPGLVAHGIGTGQLSHGASNYTQEDVSSPEFSLFRSFVNDSGGLITIREVGAAFEEDLNLILMIRDILDTPIDLNAGDSLNIQYKIQYNDTNSYCRHFKHFLSVHGVDINQTARNITGTTQNRGINTHIVNSSPSVGSYTGIVVGTGTTPVSNSNYNLESIIEHGTSAGRLIYGTLTNSPFNVDTVNDTLEYHLDRTFTNNSIDPITITEVGIYTGSVTTTLSSSLYMPFRRVLSQPITINPNQSRLIRWVWRYEL